jgi:DNA repair exonuclease SbcCD nuclease subunit
MIEQSEERGIRTCIFGGDFHHVRSAINISTLNYSVSGLKLLNDYFDHTFFIIGNHDLFYRDKYEIHSLPYINQFPKITVIDEMTEIDGVAFVPWLVADQWKKVPLIKSPYMYGHFELPKFKMNAMVEMPDHGLLNATHFVNQKQVFSGHFHKRQNKGKIWYIGNTFPHNFADAWDDDRGMMVWTPGDDPEFIAWPGAPKYRTLTLSQVVGDPSKYVDDRTFAKVTLDISASYEDVNFIKELLENEINAREIQIITPKNADPDMLDEADINFESVDTIVISHLKSIESNTMDKNELIKIYQGI